MKRIDENHSFNIHVAKQVGVVKALILKEFYGWCHMKLSQGSDLVLGFPFVFYSASALGDKFPYLEPRTLARRLTELVSDGWMHSIVNNKKAYDKTKSYTINFEKYDFAVQGLKYTIRQNDQWISQFDQWIRQNGEWIRQNDQPIPPPTPPPTSSPTPTREVVVDFNRIFSILEIQLGNGYFNSLSRREKTTEKFSAHGIFKAVAGRIGQDEDSPENPEAVYLELESFCKALNKLDWWGEKMITAGMIQTSFTKITQRLISQNGKANKAYDIAKQVAEELDAEGW